MDLKEFITQTISGIVDATSELQCQYESSGVIINPPVDGKGSDLYRDESPAHTQRRIQTIEFDVAITAASETSGGGKVGLRILAAEAGAEGRHEKRGEEVSRVRFSIPLVLASSVAEALNKAAFESAREQHRKEIKSARTTKPWIERP